MPKEPLHLTSLPDCMAERGPIAYLSQLRKMAALVDGNIAIANSIINLQESNIPPSQAGNQQQYSPRSTLSRGIAEKRAYTTTSKLYNLPKSSEREMRGNRKL